MKKPRLTIIRKVTLGYLILVLFGLGAVGYSLHSLNKQNSGAAEIVTSDIRAQKISQQLRNALLALERLETQALILRQPELLNLYQTKKNELAELWETLPTLPEEVAPDLLHATFAAHQQAEAELAGLIEDRQWDAAKNLSATKLSLLRTALLDDLNRLVNTSGVQVDLALKELAWHSRLAAQVVLALMVIGALLAALVLVSLRASIRASIRHFTEAIQTIGNGAFELDMPLTGDNEFQSLAVEFQSLGRKLREIEQQSLDANPLTGLPGNRAIEREVEQRIAAGIPFAHGFADLDHFKAYNDRYGYRKGSEVIGRIGEIVRRAVAEHGTPGDMVGHIGGDDYIFLTPPDHADRICQAIIQETDRICPEFYSEEDRRAGHFIARDRYGIEREFPLLSISIAVVCSDQFDHPTGQALGRECARIKEHLKKLPGSRYLVDRRRSS